MQLTCYTMENLVDIRCRIRILSEMPENDVKLSINFARSKSLKNIAGCDHEKLAELLALRYGKLN